MMANISHAEIDQAVKVWPSIAPILFVPQNEAEYDTLVEILHRLLDQGGSDEHHPLAHLVNIVGTLIADYERQQHLEFVEP